jgi:hypothetical protein
VLFERSFFVHYRTATIRLDEFIQRTFWPVLVQVLLRKQCVFRWTKYAVDVLYYENKRSKLFGYNTIHRNLFVRIAATALARYDYFAVGLAQRIMRNTRKVSITDHAQDMSCLFNIEKNRFYDPA